MEWCTRPLPSIHLFSDASGTWGCGAYWNTKWLQLPWPQDWLQDNIATKELVPIVAAVALWGQYWHNSAIRCHCDNMAIVSAINSGRAKYQPVNRLLRCLFFFTAHSNIAISTEHIPGIANTTVDAISRNLPLPLFSQLSTHPSPLPEEMKRILLDKNLHWSSPSWRTLFSACLAKVSPQHPIVHIPRPAAVTSNSAHPSISQSPSPYPRAPFAISSPT